MITRMLLELGHVYIYDVLEAVDVIPPDSHVYTYDVQEE